MVTSRISILLLPEDSSKDAIATLEALTRELLGLAIPGYRKQAVEFEALKDHLASQALPGQIWRSRNPKDYPKKIALLRQIASKLAEGNTSFVLCHLDADEIWSQRRPGKVNAAVSEFAKFLGSLAAWQLRYRQGRMLKTHLYSFSEQSKNGSYTSSLTTALNLGYIIIPILH